jgi:hypothetical protein
MRKNDNLKIWKDSPKQRSKKLTCIRNFQFRRDTKIPVEPHSCIPHRPSLSLSDSKTDKNNEPVVSTTARKTRK